MTERHQDKPFLNNPKMDNLYLSDHGQVYDHTLPRLGKLLHTPAKAVEIILDAKRGNVFAETWIKMVMTRG